MEKLQAQLSDHFAAIDQGHESFLVISGWFAFVSGLALIALAAVLYVAVCLRMQPQLQETAAAVVRVFL